MRYRIMLVVENGEELDAAMHALNESDLGGRALDTIEIEPKR